MLSGKRKKDYAAESAAEALAAQAAAMGATPDQPAFSLMRQTTTQTMPRPRRWNSPPPGG